MSEQMDIVQYQNLLDRIALVGNRNLKEKLGIADSTR